MVDERVRVGVGVLLVKHLSGSPGQALVLVGKRKGSHGAGMVALPGGHLEYKESFAECAQREVLEETGIALATPPTFAYATNDVIDGSKHYVTIYVRADVDEGTEAQVLEPEKCEGWSWVPLDQVPLPHFPPLASLLASGFKL